MTTAVARTAAGFPAVVRNIRIRLAEEALTQEVRGPEMAARTGLDPAQISVWMFPSAPLEDLDLVSMAKMCAALGVPVAEVLRAATCQDLTLEEARREAARLTAYADERTEANRKAVEILRTAIESAGFTIEG